MDPLPNQDLQDSTVARPLLECDGGEGESRTSPRVSIPQAQAKEHRPLFQFQKVGRLKQIERVQSSAGEESSSPEKSTHRRRRRRVPFLQLGLLAPGLVTNSFFSVSFFLKKFIDLPGGQINDPSSGKNFSPVFLLATLKSWSPSLG